MAEDALAFRVLRLAKPSIGVSQPIKFVLGEDAVSDNTRQASNSTASTSDGKGSFADRVQLQTALDACGVTGSLVLSKSFGEAYLGEVSTRNHRCACAARSVAGCYDAKHAAVQSFVGYVSLINKSSLKATDIGVKVRL